MTKRRGRASKLTPEVQARIVKALEAGCYFDAACEGAGIGESTGYRWLERGEAGDAGYREFREAVKRAEAVAEAGALAAIRSAYQGGTWQAAAWYLERKHPERWGKSDRLKLEARAVQVEEQSTGEDAREKLLRLVGRMRPPSSERDNIRALHEDRLAELE